MNRLILDRKKTYQTFDRFGVSGAWWAQVVGGWDETDEASGLPKRERVAQLLFDPAKGIGVRCYRYNLGAGSMQSGKGRYDHECRRAESFDVSETDYDWGRDANAVWMMKEAVKRGADEVILFVNSPPERWTRNGMAHLEKAGRTNLSRAHYGDFARYCLDCAEHFLAEGVPVKSVSPVNEPVWVWTGGQEGCHYRPHQVYELMKVFAREMDKRPALKELKLSGAENGDVRWFNKTYSAVMLHDKAVRRRVDAVDVHSYFLTPNIPLAAKLMPSRASFLRRYRAFMDLCYPGVAVRTSEWTHMKGGRDYGMDSALEQTKVILEDLTLLNVTAWQLWIAVSNVDYCDGLLYENDDSRTFETTKRYYAFGNFTKFIEPGSVRIKADAGNGLSCAAFMKNGRTVAVVANPGAGRHILLPTAPKAVYLTDPTHDLSETDAERLFFLPAKSVITLIFED